MEALAIPKQYLIQKLIIFNFGGHYVKNIFKIKITDYLDKNQNDSMRQFVSC